MREHGFPGTADLRVHREWRMRELMADRPREVESRVMLDPPHSFLKTLVRLPIADPLLRECSKQPRTCVNIVGGSHWHAGLAMRSEYGRATRFGC